MNAVITNIRDLQAGQHFRYINRQFMYQCVLNNSEDGIVLVMDTATIGKLTYHPKMVTSDDMCVMAEHITEFETVEYAYLTNENSNITHFTVNSRPICGSRFTQNSTKAVSGPITCDKCRKLAPKSNILG